MNICIQIIYPPAAFRSEKSYGLLISPWKFKSPSRAVCRPRSSRSLCWAFQYTEETPSHAGRAHDLVCWLGHRHTHTKSLKFFVDEKGGVDATALESL